MTAPRDRDRLIDAFLAEGLTELPSRSYDEVRDHIETTRQRVVIGLWRESSMTAFVRVAIVAAAVLVAVAIGANFTQRASEVGGPGPSSSPTVAPPGESGPPAYTWPTRLEAGTYTTSLVWDPALQFTFTVPAGWDSRDLGVTKGKVVALQLYQVDNVYVNPCDLALQDPPVTTPDDFVAAIMAVPDTEATEPTPASIGGREATYLELTITSNGGCPSSYRLLNLDQPFRCEEGCGSTGSPYLGVELLPLPERNRIWVVPIGRAYMVVDAVSSPDATTADLAELQGVIDSLQIATPDATPAPVPAAS